MVVLVKLVVVLRKKHTTFGLGDVAMNFEQVGNIF